MYNNQPLEWISISICTIALSDTDNFVFDFVLVKPFKVNILSCCIMVIRKIYCVALLFVWVSKLVAQNNHHHLEWSHYGISDGVSHKQINQTFQDKRGLLWLVTQNGLNVFDGHKAYLVSGWPALVSPRIIQIRAEDNRGMLWMRYYDERVLLIRLFDSKSRVEVSLCNRLDTLQTGTPVDVTTNSEGLLLLINTRGELWKESSNGSWQLFSTSLGRFKTFCGGMQRGDMVWLSNENTCQKPGDIDIITVSSDGKSDFITSLSNYNTASVASNGMLWVHCTDKSGFVKPTGQISWLPITRILKKHILSEYCFSEFDPESCVLWIWNDDKLSAVKCLFSGDKIDTHVLCSSNMKLVPFGMELGNRGSIFISAGDGVYCPEITESAFTRILWEDEVQSSSLKMREARGLLETKDGSIYMLVGNYLHSYDRITGKSNLVYPVQVGISYLIEDPVDRSIWFGALYNFNPDSKKTKKFELPLYGRWGVTWSAAFLDSGKLLLGTSDGLIVFERINNSASYFNINNSFTGLKFGSIHYFHEEHAGEWWLLSDNGLYIMSKDSGVIARYGSSQSGKYYLPADNFRHYYRDNSGIYWLATAQGLIRWDRSAGKFELTSTEQGLPNNNLYAVYADRSQFLWMSSDHGIIQFHPNSGALRYFLSEDGITSNEFNRISHLQTKDGTIFFGGINGVTSFHPDELYFNPNEKSRSEVVLMSVKSLRAIDNMPQEELIQKYYSDGKIIIGPGYHLLNIEFSMPNYSANKGVTYSYMIEGLSHSWVHTKSPLVQLVGLTPGKYTLTIKARAGSGMISGKETKILIEVQLYFYQKIWFRLLCIGILILLVRIFMRLREKMLLNRQSELEEIVIRSTEKIRNDKELIEQQAAMLEDQNRAQRRFFANLSHEFRTPLSLVMGPVDVVRKQPNLSRRTQSLLDIAYGNSRRLLDLIDSILILSSNGVHQFRRLDESFDIKSLVMSVYEEYNILSEQKNIELQVDCSDTVPDTVVMDPKILRIILNNLMSNAIKYTSTGGEIIVRLLSDRGWIVLSVQDTGRGIYPDDLSRIFERYFQTSRLDSPLEGGTGIGLALVKELVDMMGGAVNVESKPGEGSTFTIKLPLTEANSEQVTVIPGVRNKRRKKTSPGFGSRDKNMILLVEDNPDFLQYLDFLLNEYYYITVASNGREALEILKTGMSPDLIITDWMMPEMDGMQMVRELRSDQRLAAIPVIFLTARSGYEDINQAIRIGHSDYLVKPVEESELLTITNRLIERSLRVKDLKAKENLTHISDDRFIQETGWLKKLQEETIKGMGNELFSVDQLATVMLMGRTSFYKEVKRLTGLTPNEYILEARLIEARNLMETHSNLTITKVVKSVGLKDEGHFSRAFKKRFGKSPSWYM